MDYERRNHSKYLLIAHIILVIKYRKKLLDVIGDDIKILIQEISIEDNFEIYTKSGIVGLHPLA